MIEDNCLPEYTTESEDIYLPFFSKGIEFYYEGNPREDCPSA
jgi:hypothetical protein